MSTIHPYLLLCVLLISSPAGVWTQCQACKCQSRCSTLLLYCRTILFFCLIASGLVQFQLNPNPVEYDSGIIRATGGPGLPTSGCSGTSLVSCLASSTPIGDDVRESTSLTDLSSTLAWNQDVTITIGLNTLTRVRGVNLFFYNIPSMGIGFPHEIELTWGDNTIIVDNPLRHAVLGNTDLSQSDNSLRNVTIAVLPDNIGDMYRAVSITFRFSDTSGIRWLILSEVEICTEGTHIYVYSMKVLAIITISHIVVNYSPRQDSIPVTTQGDEVIRLEPNTIWSQIDLTCTAVIEGSFKWVWSGPGVDDSQKILTNTNRTSSITIPQLSTDSAGMYSCLAMYDSQSLPAGVTSSANGSISFTLQFDSKYTLKVGSQYGRKLLRYSASSGFYMINAKNISDINLCQIKSDVYI